MYKMDGIKVPNGVVSIEHATIKELWREAAFLQAIPHTCPVDGSATRFGYKEPGSYKYYVLFSTGATVFEFKFGQDAATGELFPGSYDKAEDKTHWRWTHWDYRNKREIIAWEDGQLTEDGKRLLNGNGHGAPPATNGAVQHRAPVEAEIDFGPGPSGTAKRTTTVALRQDFGVSAGNPLGANAQGPVSEPAELDILVDRSVPEWIFSYVERCRGADTGRDATEKQHAFAVRLVDDVCGKGTHRAALLALLGREVTAGSPVTEAVFKEILKTSTTTYANGQPVKNEFYSARDKEALRNVYAWAIGEPTLENDNIPF